MCIKFIVFYTIVFSVKHVLSGVNINNGSNLGNTHEMYLNNQNNVKNGHNTNKPLDLPNISRNINHHAPILRQYDQIVKLPSHNPPLLRFRPPLNKAGNQFLNEHVSLPNKEVENVHNSGNQFTVTSPRNDKVFLNDIEGHPQRILKQEDNRPNNHPEKFKLTPFGPVTEYKNVVRTTTGLVKNESMKILMSPTLQPAPSVPHFEVKKQPSNKLTSHINDGQRSKINNNFNHEKSADNQQTVLNHEGHIQPQLQKPRNNIQTNHSPQNKRFTVIHDNGSVEYFEDLQTILRKYPHIRIADNIRKRIPNQKPKDPLPTARNSDNNANKNPLVQNTNVPNENILPRTTVNTLKSTHKPKIESINQPKNIPPIKSNYNYSLHTTTKLPVKVDNKNCEKLQTTIKEPIKPKNHIPITSSDSNEYNVKNFITTTKNQENLTTKSSDISDMNNKTTLKNMTAFDGNRQKPPIDVVLYSDQVQHKENKANTSVIPNKVNSQKVNSKLEKDDELEEDNLHLNDSKEVITSIVLQNKTNIKTVNNTSENKPEIKNNTSSSNHDTVGHSETQPNCTKTNEFKNQLKTNNNVVINPKYAEEMDEDYDEDLLSLAKPLMWFSTTDPDFWKKLVSVDDNPNFLYIINVQSQPKIEKDRKTTIHANGTIVEEITETIWNTGDDERPKITKTIKVVPAKADNDGI